jgi:hypothetical protein
MASLAFLVLATGTVAFAQFSTEVGPDFLKNARPLHAPSRLQKDSNFNFSLENGSGIPGVDSLANFTGQFDANGIGVSGSPQDVWLYSMVGNRPERGGTTFIQSQWADADMRATFFHSMREDWHTLLFPELERQVTMSVPFGAYQAVANTDGSCCLFVLVDYNTFSNLLFPPTYPVDNTTLIGAAELSGVMTTKKISTFLFPNTYLYEGNVNNCCVLGFHGPDMEPGIPANGNLERFYMAIYTSWISPGLYGSGFQDVAALSHEMAETFNDPFVGFDNVHNITPWWLSGTQCQDLLEVGDVVESLPANVTIPVKNIFGQTYSLQNVALLQWFEFQSPSTALGGAYSYPNPASLPALSPFENPGCPAP